MKEKPPPIILDAFIECINDSFKKSRKEAKDSGQTITNPNYWEQGRFISLDGFDRYGNIIYRETQSGTNPKSKNHIISIAYPYCKYKPYYDRWMVMIKREEKMKEIGI